MSKIDKFRTGAVKVKMTKDLPYMKEGKAIEKLKDTPLFKKDQTVKLTYRKAGELAKDGYCKILDENLEPINTKEKAAER